LFHGSLAGVGAAVAAMALSVETRVNGGSSSWRHVFERSSKLPPWAHKSRSLAGRVRGSKGPPSCPPQLWIGSNIRLKNPLPRVIPLLPLSPRTSLVV
jgi:hypothetical protein